MFDDPLLVPLFKLYAFLIGTIVGSFLNVCIFRIPAGRSIVSPRSRCPHCNEMIRWYHNIPILSYLLLRARCAKCGAPISPVYPFVELLTGTLFFLLYHYFGFTIATFIYAYFGCSLIILIFIDYYHQLLPAVITFPGVAVGLLSSMVNPLLHPLDSLLGFLLGAALPMGVYLIFKWVRKKEALGHGDIVLLGMVGAFLGYTQVLLVLFASSLVGSLVGIAIMIASKQGSDLKLPYGTFIGAAALPAIFWGQQIWDVYFNFRL